LVLEFTPSRALPTAPNLKEISTQLDIARLNSKLARSLSKLPNLCKVGVLHIRTNAQK